MGHSGPRTAAKWRIRGMSFFWMRFSTITATFGEVEMEKGSVFVFVFLLVLVLVLLVVGSWFSFSFLFSLGGDRMEFFELEGEDVSCGWPCPTPSVGPAARVSPGKIEATSGAIGII